MNKVNEISNRLVLGTAQLGLPYGIANKTGRPDQAISNRIIESAWMSGITTFDTAQGYGNAEQVLGRAFSDISIAGDAKVISKLHPDISFQKPGDWIESVATSIKTLGVQQLYGLLLHREDQLPHWHEGLSELAHQVVADGYVKRFGVSVYAVEAAIQAIRLPEIGIVQLPANILDRRFVDAGVFEIAEQEGVEIHIRSAFLQGLVLMPVEAVPETMAAAKGPLAALDKICTEHGITRQELALGYLKQEFPNSMVLFGAETPEQVAENVNCWKNGPDLNIPQDVWKQFEGIGTEILDPSRWSS